MRTLDEVIEAFDNYVGLTINTPDDPNRWALHYLKEYRNAKDINVPNKERKTGTWEAQPSTGDDRPFIWWKCSVCGHVIFSETERDRKEFHAYCGRCGADMRGKHE